MKILALIPARSGSERVANKNIQLLNGKPLIAYALNCAKKSKYINKIVVSTDSNEIAMIAKQYGVEIPFLRPKEISQRDSTEMQFLEHMLNWYKRNEKYTPDLIVLLYPTSPFRKPESVDRAIEEILKHPAADSLRSVRLCSEHPYKMWVQNKKYLKPFVKARKKNAHTLSYHLLPKLYIQNASIYITKPSTIFKKRSPTGDVVIPFVMTELESVDINNQVDLLFAKFLFKHLRSQRRVK